MDNIEMCPPELYPTVHQYDTGELYLVFPDVCHCPVNGGPDMVVHLADDATCVQGVENLDNQCQMVVDGVEQPPLTWGCTCPDQPTAHWLAGEHIEGEAHHLPNCPFDDCPVGTCHPMCTQVTGKGDYFCHCPCHG